MANLAQMVNVLQSLILTDGQRMLLTPTYHVFDLYQGHQGATLLPTEVTAPDYSRNGVKVQSISVSASRAANGDMTMSVVNVDPVNAAKIEIEIAGRRVGKVTGQVITAAKMDARPEFGQPDSLTPGMLNHIEVRKGNVSLLAPAKSVIVLKIQGSQ